MKVLKDIVFTAVFMMIIFVGWQWLEYHYYGHIIPNKADAHIFGAFAVSVYFNIMNYKE